MNTTVECTPDMLATYFDRPGPVAIFAVSAEGAAVGRRLLAVMPNASLWCPGPLVAEAHIYDGSLRDFIGTLWGDHAALIGVMASGIVVRAIAPWIASKYADPAVVVVDDAARFAISLLAGHEGGANRLADALAMYLGATPVITTGSEAQRRLVLGVGCRKGVSAPRILAAIDQALATQGRRRAEVYALATIDFKANEPGLHAAAAALGVPLRIVSRSRIKALQEVLRHHTFAEDVTGVAAVCIPAALLMSPHSELLAPMLAHDGVTVALAQDHCGWWDSAPEDAST